MTAPRPDIVLDLSRVVDPIGVAIELAGQRFAIIACRPREVTWRGACQPCGAPFEAMTPRIVAGLTRRCWQHRSPGRPARATAQADRS